MLEYDWRGKLHGTPEPFPETERSLFDPTVARLNHEAFDQTCKIYGAVMIDQAKHSPTHLERPNDWEDIRR